MLEQGGHDAFTGSIAADDTILLGSLQGVREQDCVGYSFLLQ